MHFAPNARLMSGPVGSLRYHLSPIIMPIFEYRCKQCGTRFSQLVGMTADEELDPCPKCGGKELDRLVSRFRHGRNEDDRLDDMADRLEAVGEPDSPSAMREMARELGKAMDDDMSDEMEEMFETDSESPEDEF